MTDSWVTYAERLVTQRAAITIGIYIIRHVKPQTPGFHLNHFVRRAKRRLNINCDTLIETMLPKLNFIQLFVAILNNNKKIPMTGKKADLQFKKNLCISTNRDAFSPFLKLTLSIFVQDGAMLKFKENPRRQHEFLPTPSGSEVLHPTSGQQRLLIIPVVIF